MILEGIVTTLSADGEINIAPMGPRVDASGNIERIELRPFRSAHTYRNLRQHAEGVFHLSDDVLLLAKAAVGKVEPMPALTPASRVKGWVLADCCRYFEFRVGAIDDREERVRIDAEIVHRGRVRDFLGFNRAKHAVVEAAILATRTSFLPREEIAAEFRRLKIIVQKTGGEQEHEAFAFLETRLRLGEPGA